MMFIGLRLHTLLRVGLFTTIAAGGCSLGDSPKVGEDCAALRACYPDPDGDGYAVAGALAQERCSCGPGLTDRAPVAGVVDCDGADKDVHPGAVERCNGANDDCDGETDEGASASCAIANASAICEQATCKLVSCEPGYGDCSRDASGCEQSLNVAEHCGECGRACPALSVCAGARESASCQCAPTAFEQPPVAEGFRCAGSGPLAVGSHFEGPPYNRKGFLCAIRADRSVKCWGGLPSPPASARFVQISGSQAEHREQACGVTTTGEIRCWLGPDNPAAAEAPEPPSGSGFLAVSADASICGIDAAGAAVCSNPDPRRLPSNTRPYRQISAGTQHTCALGRDGVAGCWGAGRGTDTSMCAQVYECGQSNPPGGAFAQLATGTLHTCGLRPNGTVECWGAGRTNTGVWPEFGQSTVPNAPFRFIAASLHRTCGIRASNYAIECWGSRFQDANDFNVLPPPGDFELVVMATSHACGLTRAGHIRCWGDLGSGADAIPESITDETFPLVP